MPPNAALNVEETSARDDSILRLSLDAFEGPLDLLLHLIRKHELDIFDIPIAFITDEYLSYLEEAAEGYLAVAGEYLVMAATLLQMKSALLLPTPESEEDEDDEDPREALIRRLLTYQSFKDAAERINAGTRLFRDVFPRPEVPARALPPRTVDDIEPPNVFELVGALQDLLRQKRTPPMHDVTRHELSIKDSILRIAQYLDGTPRTTFHHLVALAPHESIAHRAVITFMGLLEMAKLRLITLFQARLRSDDLIVERAVIDLEEIALQLDFSDPDIPPDTPDDEPAEAPSHVAEDDAQASTEGADAEQDGTERADAEQIEADQASNDLARVESLDDIASIPTAERQDDQALLEERRAAMRGRPRYVPPDTLVRQSESEAAEAVALSQLHAELDNYDLDAVLAQAFELSKVGVSSDSQSDNEPAGTENIQNMNGAPTLAHESGTETSQEER